MLRVMLCAMLRAIKISLLLTASVFVTRSALADVDADVKHLQERWAEINYQMEGKTQQTAFDALMKEAEGVVAANATSADALIWSGIIKSTYAGAKGGLGALSLAKASKAELEKAMSINDKALQGSAYTSLGALYYSVPGWPVGFGDDKKAEELLKQALALNPDGIDSNYFYGSFLINQKRYADARLYLQKAQQATARPGRALADSGRQQEITKALASIANKK
jgi:tetratricopeptide (TPR) repeat protein